MQKIAKERYLTVHCNIMRHAFDLEAPFKHDNHLGAKREAR